MRKGNIVLKINLKIFMVNTTHQFPMIFTFISPPTLITTSTASTKSSQSCKMNPYLGVCQTNLCKPQNFSISLELLYRCAHSFK